MANARKDAAEPAPAPVTVPVIPPDEAWDAELQAKEDNSLAEETVLEKTLIVLQDDFDRRLDQMVKEHDAKVAALKDQKARHSSIRLSCQAARSALKNQSNVVPMKPATEEVPPIPQFLREPATAPAA